MTAAQPARRSSATQAARRHLERAIRVDVLAFARWSRHRRVPPRAVADRLHLAPATMAAWNRAWRRDRMAPAQRGRPLQRTDRDTINRVVAVLHTQGPGVGFPTLRALFPQLARRELEHIMRRYRRVYRQRLGRRLIHVLGWTQPGAVWAMDFTEPPYPIEGVYGDVLVVRDLGSGKTLAALPVPGQSAERVRDLLRVLFARHGAPLVIKSDNGSPLVAEIVAALLRRWDTLALVSPPGTPSYNGACEAGLGGIKTRAHHLAAHHGRPGEWTCDDVEAARLQANQTARPRGSSEPTPDEAWDGEPTVTLAQRAALAAAVADQRAAITRELTAASTTLDAASIERIAISRALVELGFLQLRRRRITLPITQRSKRKIS